MVIRTVVGHVAVPHSLLEFNSLVQNQYNSRKLQLGNSRPLPALKKTHLFWETLARVRILSSSVTGPSPGNDLGSSGVHSPDFSGLPHGTAGPGHSHAQLMPTVPSWLLAAWPLGSAYLPLP